MYCSFLEKKRPLDRSSALLINGKVAEFLACSFRYKFMLCVCYIQLGIFIYICIKLMMQQSGLVANRRKPMRILLARAKTVAHIRHVHIHQ